MDAAKNSTMSDKSKKLCQGKDTFERINFLYQAASQIANKSKVPSCYYGQRCQLISKKSLQRIEPEMKRTICKQCGLILMPGVSADISITDDIREDPNECIIKCDKYKTSKRFVVNSKYNLWLDTPEAICETIPPKDESNKQL